MTIRFTCAGCGSLLKIKDDLAGTDGKCPKCKTEFVVPEADDQESSDSVELVVAAPKKREAAEPAAKPHKPISKLAEKTAEKPAKIEKREEPAETPAESESEVVGLVETGRNVDPIPATQPPHEPPASTDDQDSDDSVEIMVMAPSKHEPAVEKVDKPAPTAAVKTPPKSEKPVHKPIEKAAGKSPSKSRKPGGDDFDPADFLMGDGDGPKRPAPNFGELSDPEVERPRPAPAESRPSRPSVGKAPTPGGAATGGGFNASSHAKDMMMKAMEESRAHAGDPHVEEKPEGFDYAGFFREFGLKGGVGLVGIFILFYGLYTVFDGMMSTKLKLPKLGYVTGTVTLDGQPLAGATVHFAPVEATMADSKKERARTSFGVTDEKGFYRMTYIERTQGVAVGRCRVWLDLITPEGQKIPPEFTEAALTVREVKPGNQEFPFDLKSK